MVNIGTIGAVKLNLQRVREGFCVYISGDEVGKNSITLFYRNLPLPIDDRGILDVHGSKDSKCGGG